MKAFTRLSSPLLALALLTAPVVWGQIITGKGFTADPNGYRSDEPLPSPQQKVGPETIIKDCPDCPEMVVLASGIFLMGTRLDPEPAPDPFSDAKEKKSTVNPNETPQHRVQIQSFAIGKYEVTQEQWFAVMGTNPSANKGRTLPVERVTWDEVQDFIDKLNQKTGKRYRLPSEAEWEYAARAGTTTEWSFGNDATILGDYAWYLRNGEGKTQVVGQKLPNAFGLFDMYGNVWEWTQDCAYNSYVNVRTDGRAESCGRDVKVLRGGSFAADYADWRSASRKGYSKNMRNINIGFRLARDL